MEGRINPQRIEQFFSICRALVGRIFLSLFWRICYGIYRISACLHCLMLHRRYRHYVPKYQTYQTLWLVVGKACERFRYKDPNWDDDDIPWWSYSWLSGSTNQLDYLDGTTIDFLQLFFKMNPVKKRKQLGKTQWMLGQKIDAIDEPGWFVRKNIESTDHEGNPSSMLGWRWQRWRGIGWISEF